MPTWRLLVALIGLPVLLAADAAVRQLTGEDGLQPGVAVLALGCLLGTAATGFGPERATERRVAQVVGAALTVVGVVLSVAHWMA